MLVDLHADALDFFFFPLVLLDFLSTGDGVALRFANVPDLPLAVP